jgi:hypothetical protein
VLEIWLKPAALARGPGNGRTRVLSPDPATISDLLSAQKRAFGLDILT